jgi:hypothetical protein
MNHKILVDPVAPVEFDFRNLHDEIDGFEVKDVCELGCRLKDTSI